jgi:hypothetical protein
MVTGAAWWGWERESRGDGGRRERKRIEGERRGE